ncbi:MAG: energy transducer TonB [Deltaproteobacteria bacterium]|nr:energy transducer TonB [Deltaproteobacteria bacterium]
MRWVAVTLASVGLHGLMVLLPAPGAARVDIARAESPPVVWVEESPFARTMTAEADGSSPASESPSPVTQESSAESKPAAPRAKAAIAAGDEDDPYAEELASSHANAPEVAAAPGRGGADDGSGTGGGAAAGGNGVGSGVGSGGGTATAKAIAQAPVDAAGHPDLRAFGVSLAKRIATKRSYPALSREREEEGSVAVRVPIAADGSLLPGVLLVKSSGFALLDAAALQMVRAAQPFDRLPPAYATGAVFIVPVKFELED